MTAKELEKKYNKLESYEQEMLQIVCLLFEPITKTDFISFVRKCGVRKKGALRTINYNTANDGVKKLLADFLYINPEKLLEVRAGIDDYILIHHCAGNTRISFYRSIISEERPVMEKSFYAYRENYLIHRRLVRDFRIAFYLSEKEHMDSLRELAVAGQDEPHKITASLYVDAMSGLVGFCFVEAVPRFENVPGSYRPLFLGYLLDTLQNRLLPQDELLAYLEQVMQENEENKHYAIILSEGYFFQGAFNKVTELAENFSFSYRDFKLASALFLGGDPDKAKTLFIAAIEEAKKGKKTRNFCPPALYGLYFCLTMAVTGDTEHPLFTGAVRKGISKKNFGRSYLLFKALAASLKGDKEEERKSLDKALYGSNTLPEFSLFEMPVAQAVLNMIGDNYKNKFYPLMNYYVKPILENGYDSIGYQMYKLLYVSGEKYTPGREVRKAAEKLEGRFFDFSKCANTQEGWRKSLMILKNIAASSVSGPARADKKAGAERLAWYADISDDRLRFIPREQKMLKNGSWSKGRPVSLKRIAAGGIPAMSELDIRIGTCIEEYKYGYYSSIERVLNLEKAAPYLIKHPFLFLENTDNVPFEFFEEDLQLVVRKEGSFYILGFSYFFLREGYTFYQETPTRFKAVKVKKVHMQIKETFGEKGELSIPCEAEDELKEIVSSFSSLMTVHSDITGSGFQDIPSAPGDTTPHIHLLPIGESIKAEFFVRPFLEKGPYFKPGQGAGSVLAEIEGEQRQAERDLNDEKERARSVIKKCPSLAIRGGYYDIFTFETDEECLEVLLDLQELGDEVKIFWPEGEKVKFKKQYSSKSMSVSAKLKTDWFEITGLLKIDEDKVLNMLELFELHSGSRFIEIKKGEFIALTDELRRKIEALKGFTYRSGNTIKVHPLSAFNANEIIVDFEQNKMGEKWEKQIARTKEALSFVPRVPEVFQAELRPYQLEGFNWLSRLARWGVGACLADDMGLGKTIQALAVLVDRAAGGPSLVVAPSSVCYNWVKEANTFAPSLKVHFFGPGNRQEMLDGAGTFDLIVCSYGLLLQEEEKLAEITWNTTVLDEAQSIKNYKAKRTKAAFGLKSNFKMITTGTPVENHLLELWTLFNFINPGFLGTQGEFSRKFLNNPDDPQNAGEIRSLQKLIRPFILRRTKTQVLEELPPKTEITLTVEMSENETAFYEAMRRKFLGELESADESGSDPGHIEVLAALTKLRLCCCHPALMSGDFSLESSKQKLFVETVEELIENRHKALVFSQFVKHLEILRKVCEKKGISYQYLDGSTPTKERQKRIDAFQAGQGDVFLISLKAGGTGLNLTAADYVIHMDPWWNPAVEDQASDRAHRIGQQRPVTVYRLVTKGTVEEKIITLHKNKRALADSLLEGADMAGKISARELLDLMQ